MAIGPNILDLMKLERIDVWEEQEITCVDGSKQTMKTLVEKQVWRLRPSDEFFSKPGEKATAKKSDNTESLYQIFRMIGDRYLKASVLGGLS